MNPLSLVTTQTNINGGAFFRRPPQFEIQREKIPKRSHMDIKPHCGNGLTQQIREEL
jgi:hypothetical protein